MNDTSLSDSAKAADNAAGSDKDMTKDDTSLSDSGAPDGRASALSAGKGDAQSGSDVAPGTAPGNVPDVAPDVAPDTAPGNVPDAARVFADKGRSAGMSPSSDKIAYKIPGRPPGRTSGFAARRGDATAGIGSAGASGIASAGSSVGDGDLDEDVPIQPTALHYVGDPPPSTGGGELLKLIDSVAREKGINKDEAIDAIEAAIQKAGASKYGHEFDIHARFDPNNGHISLSRQRLIVEEVNNPNREILLADAVHLESTAKLGEGIVESLPSIGFGRIPAQAAKQVITQKVRDAERAHQYEAFKDRVGEIVSGTVKRVEFGNVVVDLGRGEGVLRREDLLGRESFRRSDRVRAYIYEVRRETRGPQIFLSRSHPQFIAGLFAQEVPEIYDGVVEIRKVATEPGSRAKISVVSNDSSVDPVGTCVGMRGSRVQAVVNELQGQKIDIIPWSEDTATFVVNALTPAEVIKVIIDEDAGHIDVVVPEDHLSFAIGRRGQNVRLASQLTGWHIDVLTESKESERRNEEFKSRSQVFMDELDVDDVIAHLLVAEGFTGIEELAQTPQEYLANIEEFDDRIVKELYERAHDWMKNRKEKTDQRLRELKVDDILLTMPHLKGEDLVLLGEKGIKSRDDLADLAWDELCEILVDKKMSAEEAGETIMAARAHWFDDDKTDDSADNSGGDSADNSGGDSGDNPADDSGNDPGQAADDSGDNPTDDSGGDRGQAADDSGNDRGNDPGQAALETPVADTETPVSAAPPSDASPPPVSDAGLDSTADMATKDGVETSDHDMAEKKNDESS